MQRSAILGAAAAPHIYFERRASTPHAARRWKNLLGPTPVLTISPDPVFNSDSGPAFDCTLRPTSNFGSATDGKFDLNEAV
ncbi:hypothetical protein EVAR_82466_1 [Eumeta japonica]|uniref:Uncharacterized protein n=1 Tax=Eumeta variegata TaxID=151549 RepID=A0A4C1X808_EUMVA|nr:hypothetical protein EVAR_82466_1 [Eumeta japonica]